MKSYLGCKVGGLVFFLVKYIIDVFIGSYLISLVLVFELVISGVGRFVGSIGF